MSFLTILVALLLSGSGNLSTQNHVVAGSGFSTTPQASTTMSGASTDTVAGGGPTG